MSLSPHDRALLEAGREGLEPALDDRKRLRGAIAAQIGIAATISAASAGATATSSAAATVATTGATVAAGSGAAAVGAGAITVMKGLAVLVLVAGAGTLGYRAMHAPAEVSHPPGAMAQPPSALVPPVNTVETSTVALAEERAASPMVASSSVSSGSVAPRPPTPSAKSPSADPPAGALSQETHLVADARAALRSGDASRALMLLEEHARRFSAGVLSEERDAERVAALCAVGREEEARTRADRFSRDYPRSALGAKVRAACPAP